MATAKAPKCHFDLASGEHLIAQWKPKFSVYLLRFSMEPIIISVIVILYKSIVLYSNVPFVIEDWWKWITYIGRIFVSVIPWFTMAAFYSYIAGSYDHWSQNKNNLYYLTNRRFVKINNRNKEDDISIPLSSINKAQSFFYWKMFIRPYGAGVFEVPYLPKVKDVIRTIMNEKLNIEELQSKQAT